MTENTLSAALTFCLLAGEALAIGSTAFGLDRRAAPAADARLAIVTLPRVEVIAHRTPLRLAAVTGSSATGTPKPAP